MKQKKFSWKKTWIVVASVIGGICLLLGGFRAFFMLSVGDYYEKSEKAFFIPDTYTGFIAQGLDYDKESDAFFVTGYQFDGSASPIYVIDKKSGELKKEVALKKEDGSDFTGHAGGIAVHGEYVYVAGDKGVNVFDKEEVLTSANGTATMLGSISTKATDDDYVKVSCLTVFEGKLYVAEFFRESNYATLDSHKMTTPSGEYNQALLVGFNLTDGEEGVFGVNPKPTVAYSITDEVQGFAFDGGKIYLSRSYGMKNSSIDIHDLSKASAMENISVLGESVPLYALDGASKEKTIKAPPMSEEIVVLENKLYIMTESASNKYTFGKLLSAQWCYATDLT